MIDKSNGEYVRVGDKVRCIDDFYFQYIKRGDILTVEEVHWDFAGHIIKIKFKELGFTYENIYGNFEFVYEYCEIY